MIVFLIFGIVIFLSAYCLGRHSGRQAGVREGKASMVLELREASLREGCCFFCGASKHTIVHKTARPEDIEGTV